VDNFFTSEGLLSRARQWDISIDEIRETTGSLLAFGSRRDTQVVLKVPKKPGDEWRAGEMLRAFNGEGTVRVYESEPGAVLLERLNPGLELVELIRRGEDNAATEILAEVIRQSSNHIPPDDCPTVLDWARGFDRYVQTDDSRVPHDLVIESGELYRCLANSQQRTMLLHGDLQHYNVLFDSSRGWIAIDPKGIVGELEYEIGAILRNPVEQPELFISTAVIEQRLRILTDVLDLNYRRVLEWSFAQAILSAIWDIEDGFPVTPDHHTLRLAQSIQTLLN
jgi:streptomycin 6-kinase